MNGLQLMQRHNLPQHAICVLRAIDSGNTTGGVLLAGIRDVDTDGLRVGVVLCLADHNLDDLAVLPKVLVAAQSFKQAVFLHFRTEAGNIYEVLLHNTKAGEVLAAESVGLSLLSFFLQGDGRLLLLGGLSRSP